MKKMILLLLMVLNYHLVSNSQMNSNLFLKERYEPFSVENLRSYMSKINVSHQDVVLCQAILETGWFSSSVMKNYNNLFGLSTVSGYMKFNHWTESVDRYKLLQDKTYKGGCYYVYLDKLGYAEDPDYTSKLKRINSCNLK